MRLSKHAAKRWVERFPHLNPYEEWATIRPAGKKERRAIAASMNIPRAIRTGKVPLVPSFYWVSKSHAVFVLGKSGRVITVFPLPA